MDLIHKEHPKNKFQKNLFPYPNSICIDKIPFRIPHPGGKVKFVYIGKDVLKTDPNRKISYLPKMKSLVKLLNITFGQRWQNKSATFGGKLENSIIIFGNFIFNWMVINIIF